MAMCLDISPAERTQYDNRHREIVELLRQLTAVDTRGVSKVSAKMVELSLQEPQRGPTLRDTRKSGPVSSPLLWLPNDAQGITLPSFEEAGRKESAVRWPVAAATHLNLQQANATPSTRMDQWFFTFGRRILGPLVLSAGRSGILQRTGSLIAHLSTARAAQFLVDRLSATKVYRCRDCGRSRLPLTSAYIHGTLYASAVPDAANSLRCLLPTRLLAGHNEGAQALAWQ